MFLGQQLFNPKAFFKILMHSNVYQRNYSEADTQIPLQLSVIYMKIGIKKCV
jgi:hypothetical protein